MNDEPTDQTRWSLIGRLKNWDDRESWQEFFDSYWKLIYSVALKAGLSDTEAQEVVQETIISVAKKMPEFKCDPAAGSFRSWLLTLTRWRITDQLRKRGKGPHASALPDEGEVQNQPSQRTTPPQSLEDTARTSTIERIPDPVGSELEMIWNEEWEKNLLQVATERIKHRVDPEDFQMFDFLVLKQWPARKVASKLAANLARVYAAKYRVSALLKKEIKLIESKLLKT
jgi:RNA polymerase sigma factor (sigma-70 family)